MADNLRASWGTSEGAVSGVTGVVTSITVTRDGQEQTETDENGAVCGAFLYDWTESLSADILVRSGTQKPNVGEQITIGGVTGYVTNSSVSESNTSYRKIHVEAKRTKNVRVATVVN